jgi:long-chain fatty acid transport protein
MIVKFQAGIYMKSKLFSLGAGVFLVAALTPVARAGGFSVADFGGNHGHAASDSLTSIFYNPAGLALTDGTRAYVEGLFGYRKADFTRDVGDVDNPNVSQDALDANSGAAKLRNTVASPFAALATDLGHPGFTLAIGVSVPFGGQAKWSTVDRWAGNQMFPGAVDGPQRWSVTEGEQRSIFYTGAVAFRTHDRRFTFGAGVNVIQSNLSLTRARNVTGTDDLLNPDGSISEGRSLLEVDDLSVSVSLGVIAMPTQRLRLGISYQSQPLPGEMTMNGTLTNKFGATAPRSQEAQLRQRLPDSVRAALEWRGRRVALRAAADYTRWSAFKDQCIVDATVASSCVFLPDGSFDPSAGGSGPLLEIPRDWKNTGSVTVGGSWWPSAALELSLGFKLDSNAVPDATLEPALMDATKLISSLGARWSHGAISVDLQVSDAAFATRTTTPRTVDPVAPSRNPDMAGRYAQSILFALVGVGVHM